MENNIFERYFDEVEIEKPHDGYYYEVEDSIKVTILGSICGLKNLKQIHQWAANDKVEEFLREKFDIGRLPCYYWFTCLLKLVKPESLSRCFTTWVQSLRPKDGDTQTLSIDGKTVRSTTKMKSYSSPLHIVSAQLGELGLTFGQRSVDGKSNEIPAVQTLLQELEINGCVIVADALNCQKETARIIVKGGADYLLSVKDNQPSLKKDLEDYVQDSNLQKTMETESTQEKNRDRIETRTAYVSKNISWIPDLKSWTNMTCFGAIHTQFTTAEKKTSEWHYYISSRPLTAKELLHHARTEWTVETMHWLLDVHFGEDFCRVQDLNVQKNLNILRKCAINLIKRFKVATSSQRPISNIMFDCLLDPSNILNVTSCNQ